MNKKTTGRSKRMKQAIASSAIVATCAVAQAAPVKPHGSYSDAKIEGAVSTTGAQAPVMSGSDAVAVVPSAAAPVAAPVHVPQAAAKVAVKPAASTTEKVQKWAEKWVESKWSAFKGFTSAFTGQAPAAPAVKAAPAPAPVAVSAPARPAIVPTQVQAPTAATMPAAAAPSMPASAPVAPVVNPPSLKMAKSGVQVYDLSSAPTVPRLGIDKEQKVSSSRWSVDGINRKTLEERIIHRLESADLIGQKEFKELAVVRNQPMVAQNVKDPDFQPKGKVSRDVFEKMTITLARETPIQLRNFTPLSPEEMRFMSGLLLYHQGDKCAAAIGLFHSLANSPQWQPEADYYTAMCSRKIGLETDFMERARRVLETGDAHYSRKLLAEVGYDIPYEFTESFGSAIAKAVATPKVLEGLDAKSLANIAYLMAEYGASSEKYKVAQTWAAKVPASHPRSLQARFLMALAEYQVGSKEKALSMQEALINDVKTDKEKLEFQALVALNVGRMYFQERQFKSARENLLKVYKDHPMWLQSLTEMGWSQLMSGDYEGAIGNMYSVQSPFFASVYKPESYVIRTIGYLNLCQYGDAYRTLSILEHEYRPYLDKIGGYLTQAASRGGYYQTVRNFVANKTAKEVDGLPVSVVREMARHRDFINLQKSLNRQIDERQVYARLEDDVNKAVARAEAALKNSQRRVVELRKSLEMMNVQRDANDSRNTWASALNKELYEIEGHQFQMDLYNEAKGALPKYRKDVMAGAEKRIAGMKGQMDKILGDRLQRMKTDLARILENNELLRYEVFAGSGENIRYQVSGGEQSNRVPASIMPKSKSLQWQFDGEYWEDEIGHYRSSLKNNCPESQGRGHARLDGGEQ